MYLYAREVLNEDDIEYVSIDNFLEAELYTDYPTWKNIHYWFVEFMLKYATGESLSMLYNELIKHTEVIDDDYIYVKIPADLKWIDKYDFVDLTTRFIHPIDKKKWLRFVRKQMESDKNVEG